MLAGSYIYKTLRFYDDIICVMLYVCYKKNDMQVSIEPSAYTHFGIFVNYTYTRTGSIVYLSTEKII